MSFIPESICLLQKLFASLNDKNSDHTTYWSALKEVYNIESATNSCDQRSRESGDWNAFLQWLSDNGMAECGNFEIRQSSLGGFGLFARKSFTENDPLFQVPRPLMFVAKDALNHRKLCEFFRDPVFVKFPSLVLVFYLLYHVNNPKSFWKPYLAILPSKYTTILSMNEQEFTQMNGSQLQSDVQLAQRSFLCQYQHFIQKVSQDTPLATEWYKLFGCFSLTKFLWAYETVLTRQNRIPLQSSRGGVPEYSIALIPFWDMCNHKPGKASTDFDLNDESLMFYAMENVAANQEVFNCYANRNNVKLFLTNGFIDFSQTGPMKLTITFPKDKLSAIRYKLCTKIGLNPFESFWLNSNNSTCSSSMLTAMLRILAINDEKTLEQLIESDESEELLKVDTDNQLIRDLTPWVEKYLMIRCTVLRRQFPPESKQKSVCTNQTISKLLNDEKSILESYCLSN